jgi:hypothetical protein
MARKRGPYLRDWTMDRFELENKIDTHFGTTAKGGFDTPRMLLSLVGRSREIHHNSDKGDTGQLYSFYFTSFRCGQSSEVNGIRLVANGTYDC